VMSERGIPPPISSQILTNPPSEGGHFQLEIYETEALHFADFVPSLP